MEPMKMQTHLILISKLLARMSLGPLIVLS